MTARVPDASHRYYLDTLRQQPTPVQYYLTRICVAVLGEVSIRYTNLKETFSLKTLNNLTGNSFSFTVEPSTQSSSTITSCGLKSIFSCEEGTFCGQISNGCTNISSYVSNNVDWIVLTTVFAATTCAINHLATRKINSTYLRNAVSVFGAGAIVWFCSNYIAGYSAGINEIADIGLRMVSLSTILKVTTPAAQWAIRNFDRSLNFLKADFSFPKHVRKVS